MTPSFPDDRERERPRRRVVRRGPPPGRMRLQKFLSDAGVASRRHAEELIREGHVLVNDEVVDTLPAFVDPAKDRVIVDGSVVGAQKPEYFILHKPKGVLCTNFDPAHRTLARDLLPPMEARLFPVGRLDADSSGLLLMTNDGELAQRVTHPSFGVPKVYRVEVKGRVAPDLAQKMKQGVYLDTGRARATDVEITHVSPLRSIVEVTLREGKNRQVRRMFAKLGHDVRNLKRVAIGPISLKALPEGAARRLSPQELGMLRRVLDKAEAEAQARPLRVRRTPGARGRDGQRSGAPRRRDDERRSGTKPGARSTAQPTRRIVT